MTSFFETWIHSCFGRPLCTLRKLVWSLELGAWCDGHAYLELPDTPANIQVLRCQNCDHLNIIWSHEPIPGKHSGMTIKLLNINRR